MPLLTAATLAPQGVQLGPPDGPPEQQTNYGADGGADQFADEADGQNVQAAEDQPADDGADEADRQIDQQSAAAAEDGMCKPAGKQANDDPFENAHCLPRLHIQHAPVSIEYRFLHH